MDSEDLLGFIFFISLAISSFLVLFKVYAIKGFQKKHNLVLPLRLFTVYGQEHIYSTTSIPKRDFMIFSNRLTIAMYLLLFPSSVFLVINFAYKVTNLLL